MTLITFQDGAVVFRDGQVGTEQACCCQPECKCAFDNFTSSFTNDGQCNIEYISVEIEFRFSTCGNALGEAEFTLNAENFWQENKLVNDENGTEVQASAALRCGFVNGQFDKYYLEIGIAAVESPCLKLCDSNLVFINSISPQLIIGNISRDDTCCPAGPSGGPGQLDTSNCQGSYVAVTNYSIVLS
jgi:hypothetical protein